MSLYTLVNENGEGSGLCGGAGVLDELSTMEIGNGDVPLAFNSVQEAETFAMAANQQNPGAQFSPKVVTLGCEIQYRDDLATGRVKPVLDELNLTMRRARAYSLGKSFLIGAIGVFALGKVMEYTGVFDKIFEYFNR